MRLSTAITVALTALLVAAALGVATAAPAAELERSHSSGAAAAPAGAALQPADPQQVIRINITADGDARWTIESRFHLQDDDGTDEFYEYADAVTDGERDVGYDAATFERFLTEAERNTEREMSIEDAGWDEPRTESSDGDELQAETVGVVSYSFTWTNFTAVEGSRLYLGDAFETDDGTWFPALTDSQRLVIESPPNYGFEDPPIGARDGMLVWDGPHQFGENELEVTFLRGATDPGTGGGNGTEPPDPPGVFESLVSSISTLAWIGLFALFVLVGVAGYLLATRYPPSELFTDGSETTTGRDAPSDDRREGRSREDGASPPTASFEGANVGERTGFDDEVDVELLSDEERVHRLLRANGGRMKQASIVEETGWSNAKVSQLLSKMDENGEIDKLRIGRENLITLPEVDPTEVE